jgi:hypothetical protein
MGYSVGRWDGDTLVVDSFGFNDRTWLARGFPHTEGLRMTERYRRIDFGHLGIEATLQDPTVYARPWTLAADTEMPDMRCDPADSRTEHWTGKASDAQRSSVKVSPEILAKYVGVYKGEWIGRPRTVEITFSGGALYVAVEGGAPQPLAPLSDTIFSGTGLGYRFILDDNGVATDVMEIHVSGDYRLQRQK